jgi:peptidyl-dipeptidase A
MLQDVREFIDDHVDSLAPLQREARLAAWEASTRSSAASVAAATAAEARLRGLYANPVDAARVEGWLKVTALPPGPERRQLELLRKSYLENALHPDEIRLLVERERAIETEFVTYRGSVAGESVSSNRILEILGHSRDPGERLEAWEASKGIGPRVAEGLRDLVRQRNQVARRLGFRDHYAMALELQEIPEATLLSLAEALRARTEEPWRRMKTAMDRDVSRRLGLEPEALRPHHYDDPFVQEPPRAAGVGDRLDALLADHDPVALSARYFDGIGLPVEEVLARSDLYEREGKDQHAFCTDIDREGDVRILCNVRPDERWTGTMLHELGHAVYDLGFPARLPFLLRKPAHILTTEAVAQLFGRMTRDAGWLGTMLDLPPGEVSALEGPLREERSRAMLLFARWCLVMIHFERALYADPDRPDLNRTWWTLVSGLQGIHPPERVDGREDWATKIHLTVAPVYYHNYILGELLASQLERRIRGELLPAGGPPVEDPRIGHFLRQHVFAPGALPDWGALTLAATGSPLGPDAFLRDFAGSTT